MNSITVWKLAGRPNYGTNIDRGFPYSEVPFLGEYNLVKIPQSLNNLIDHVNYWGEGKVVTQSGTSGFANCYNVNHAYQLVSNGVDRDRKIPNRIPVLSYTNCDTSAYIRDNTVITVTLMGAPINTSCVSDIVRIVNNDLGRVVVYGFDINSREIHNLTDSLKNKGLYQCPNYHLPGELQGLTSFDKHIAFLNVTILKDQLYKLVSNSEYDAAVTLTVNLNGEGLAAVVNDTVEKLLASNSTISTKLMSFAYKLYRGGAKYVVGMNFPPVFKLIFDQENMTIVNTRYLQALKLDANTDSMGDRLAWGDSQDKTSKRLKWIFVPVWENNDVTFKLYNTNCDMYLKLDMTSDSMGDRQAWGSKSSEEERHRYYVEPYLKNGTLVFYIINYQYRQGLKLVEEKDSLGDRLLMGHNGDIHKDEERFRWAIARW